MCPFMLDAFAGSVMQKYGKTLPHYHSPGSTPAAPAADPAKAATTPAADETKWYIAHLGAEPCVPLDRIGHNFNRVYYGSGNFKTPDDVAEYFRRLGGHVRWIDMRIEDTRAFHVSGGDVDTNIIMISNKEMCQGVMARMQK